MISQPPGTPQFADCSHIVLVHASHVVTYTSRCLHMLAYGSTCCHIIAYACICCHLTCCHTLASASIGLVLASSACASIMCGRHVFRRTLKLQFFRTMAWGRDCMLSLLLLRLGLQVGLYPQTSDWGGGMPDEIPSDSSSDHNCLWLQRLAKLRAPDLIESMYTVCDDDVARQVFFPCL